jgi:hypothetical protein
MSNGFKEGLISILEKYGMRTGDAIGTVWSQLPSLHLLITVAGFPVESGIDNPTYDYIIMGESVVSLYNIKLAVSKLNSGGIVVARAGKEWHIIKKGYSVL